MPPSPSKFYNGEPNMGSLVWYPGREAVYACIVHDAKQATTQNKSAWT